MVSIIIVDYHSIEKTIDYIGHLSKTFVKWEEFAPIIIDNSENDDSYKWVIENYPYYQEIIIDIAGEQKKVYYLKTLVGNILYYQTYNNKGYAVGNNIGTFISDQVIGADYYIICNNDLRIVNSFNFEEIKRIFDRNEDVAVIGPKIIDTKGNVQSPRKKVSVFAKLFLFCWLSTWPFRKEIDLDYTNESKKCYWVSGCFFFVRADYFKQCSRFDEKTFLFAEEMILSERLKSIGKYVFFDNELTIIHEHGGTISKNKVSRQSERWSFNSTQYYCKKYRNTPNFVIGLASINYNVYQYFRKIRSNTKG